MKRLIICIIACLFPLSAYSFDKVWNDSGPWNNKVGWKNTGGWLSTELLRETKVQIKRIKADGGTVIDEGWMDTTIRTLKAQGVYGNVKFLGDANFAVKKDGSNAVATLYDISGNNNDATQGTGANQPIWYVNQQNGKSGVSFDGVDDFLLNAAPAYNAQSLSITAVYKKVAPLETSNTGVLAASSNGLIQFTVTDGVVNAYDTGVDYYYANAHIGLTIPNNQFTAYHISTITSSTAPLASAYGNGVLSGTTTVVASYATTGLRIGSYNDAGDYAYNGSLTSLILSNVDFTAAQRTAIEAMLNTYYAIY